ncbi:hypothetical protein IJH89_01945 [Candidatus Saccharibacteria bacterium]|nr:hypothetical protein [Candidatus Saccharibacteria bacterium]
MFIGVGITGEEIEKIRRRVRAADYLTVAQLFLRANFLLEKKLEFSDVKPRLLGHWGTCHGINVVYANLLKFFKNRPELQFILGPGHGFPALNANLFLDGELEKADPRMKRNLAGIETLCREFSTPGGFPSHASPLTPGVVTEGGELGYALATAFGAVLGHPEKTVAVLIGDGEFETGTTLSALNLGKLISNSEESGNGRVLPILHLNGYKISGPTVFARKSEREQNEMIRGFGFTPIVIDREDPERFQFALLRAEQEKNPFVIFKSEKGEGGPEEVEGQKVRGNYSAHQIPLPKAGSDETQLKILEDWLKSYEFNELYKEGEGFRI